MSMVGSHLETQGQKGSSPAVAEQTVGQPASLPEPSNSSKISKCPTNTVCPYCSHKGFERAHGSELRAMTDSENRRRTKRQTGVLRAELDRPFAPRFPEPTQFGMVGGMGKVMGR